MMKKVSKRLFKAVGLVFLTSLILTACGKSSSSSSSSSSNKVTTVKLGIVGSDDVAWKIASKTLKKENIKLKIVQFSDYNTPNTSLVDGDIDLNAFQHQYFLDNWNKTHHQNLVSIGKTVIAPMAIFSKKIKKLSDLKDGATVSVPNDATNEARALELLQTAGLIKLKKGDLPSTKDVTSNPKKLNIKTLDAAQLPTTLQDVDISVINSGVAYTAHLDPAKSLLEEKVTKKSIPWINIIVSRKKDRNNPIYKKVVKAYQTEAVKAAIKKEYGASEVTAWDIKF